MSFINLSKSRDKIRTEHRRILSSVNNTFEQLNEKFEQRKSCSNLPSYHDFMEIQFGSDLFNKNLRILKESSDDLKKEHTYLNAKKLLCRNISMTPKNQITNTHNYLSNDSSILKMNIENTSTLLGSELIKNSIQNSIQRNSSNNSLGNNEKGFCPFCPHCINPENMGKGKLNLKDYMSILIQGKNSIQKCFDYITQNFDKDKLDFIFNTNEPASRLATKKEREIYEKLKLENQSPIMERINQFKRGNPMSTKKMVFQTILGGLNSIINGDFELENFVSKNTIEELEKRFILPFGFIFDVGFSDKDNVFIDEDIESILDDLTLKKIKELYKNKFFTGQKMIKEENEKLYQSSRKKFILLFVLFIQILSEISNDKKEEALLLYKLFTEFFVEQEKKWIYAYEKMTSKIVNYRDIIKTLILVDFNEKGANAKKQPFPSLKNYDNSVSKKLAKSIDDETFCLHEINAIIGNNNANNINLQNHKKLIKYCLDSLNEVRKKYYMGQSDFEILKKESDIWIYNFEQLKYSNLRNKRIELNDPAKLEAILNGISSSANYKKFDEVTKTLIVNSEIFSSLSGQKNFFFQRYKVLSEEKKRKEKIIEDLEKTLRKEQEKNYILKRDTDFEIVKLNNEIDKLRDKTIKADGETQTDIGLIKMSKILTNDEIINKHKTFHISYLQNLYELINFKCVFRETLSKKSLLSLIADVYKQKPTLDNLNANYRKPNFTFEDYFMQYMTDKLKITKAVHKNCKSTLLTVINHANSDERIGLFKRFLCIDKKDSICKEASDIYITILNNLPVNIYNLFEKEEYKTITIPLVYAYNCLDTFLNHFNMKVKIKDDVIGKVSCFDPNGNEIREIEIKEKLFFIWNYRKNFFMFSGEPRNAEEIEVWDLIDDFYFFNKSFDLTKDDCKKIIHTIFLPKNPDAEILITDEIKEFYGKQFTFDVRVLEFCDLVLKYVNKLFESIERYYDDCTKELKMSCEFIYFKDFEKIMDAIYKSKENNWKYNRYFIEICGGNLREFISKKEIIEFLKSNKEVVSYLSRTLYI